MFASSFFHARFTVGSYTMQTRFVLDSTTATILPILPQTINKHKDVLYIYAYSNMYRYMCNDIHYYICT